MRNIKITIEESRYVDDSTGRVVVRYTPFFLPDVTATGTLRFAHYEAWDDNYCEKESAKNHATENAITCMAMFGRKVKEIY